jgi:hypothetical protein
MTIKSVLAPHLGRHVKFGRRRPVARGPRLHMANYLRLSLPTPPPLADYSEFGQPALSNIYGNDVLGDCVIAGGYHIVATASGNAGALFTATEDQIVSDYSAIGGYVLGDPSTDQGCDEETALNYWSETGFADGSKLAGWAAVDGTSVQQLQACAWLFENLMFGIELPDAWVQSMPTGSGFTWDCAGDPDPNNGHCVVGTGYTVDGVTIDTWGLLGTLTYQAIADYAVASNGGEVYVLLTPDQIAKGQAKAPNGFAWADLVSDMQQLAPIGVRSKK